MSDNSEKKLRKEIEEASGKEWYELTHRNWRAWGSWFSWGSPIGLALFYAIVLLSTGGFIWIINNV